MTKSSNSSVLSVKDLQISFATEGKFDVKLKQVSFQLEKGKTLAVVGESGSGKSITSLSILGLLPKNISSVDKGSITFEDRSTDLLELDEDEIRKIRGAGISMIFQEPMTSLNPVKTCGNQVAEILLQHEICKPSEVKNKVIELFEEVRLPNPERIINRYPHEISGGQKQRVMIAMAIACSPKILIADEPTTALDVTVQKTILDLLESLQKKYQMAILFITHDLDVVKDIAHQIAVMYKGELVEFGDTKEVLENPSHNYTKGLLSCKPPMTGRPERLTTLEDYLGQNVVPSSRPSQNWHLNRADYNQRPVLLACKNLTKIFVQNSGLLKRKSIETKAVNNVSFEVFKGETLGLVGESGCGKTTLSRMILGLIDPTDGVLEYEGKAIDWKSNDAIDYRKDLQLIFQDPYSALNPKQQIGSAIREVMEVHNIGSNASERQKRAEELMVKVGLEATDLKKYPHAFSGGQRQRIVIARALAVEPKFIICDEAVSALDVSVQAQVLNLLNDLKREFDLTYLFISHDLGVVRYMSDRIIVMNKGIIEEIGYSDDLFNSPTSTYTQQLISSIPG